MQTICTNRLYGTFFQNEIDTLRQFFSLDQEAQALGNQAAGIRQEVENIESQITQARAAYASLIAEGFSKEAAAAVGKIPSMRERQDDLKKQLPGIGERLTEIEKEVNSIDHSRFLTLAREAAATAEQSRCRAVSIFSRPSDVRKTISDARAKIK